MRDIRRVLAVEESHCDGCTVMYYSIEFAQNDPRNCSFLLMHRLCFSSVRRRRPICKCIAFGGQVAFLLCKDAAVPRFSKSVHLMLLVEITWIGLDSFHQLSKEAWRRDPECCEYASKRSVDPRFACGCRYSL